MKSWVAGVSAPAAGDGAAQTAKLHLGIQKRMRKGLALIPRELFHGAALGSQCAALCLPKALWDSPIQ